MGFKLKRLRKSVKKVAKKVGRTVKGLVGFGSRQKAAEDNIAGLTAKTSIEDVSKQAGAGLMKYRTKVTKYE